MPKIMKDAPLSYKSAGVDYERADGIKVLAQRAAAATAPHLEDRGFAEVAASRGESAYVVDAGDTYLATITECLGTKALVADATRPISGRTHYDAIAQDTIAAAVNDIATTGAAPVVIQAYWAVGDTAWFADEPRARDLIEGWRAACDRCGAAWGGGETPTLAGVVDPGAIDLAATCVGVIKPKARLLLAGKLAAGDAILLLAASGVHANGLSLARQLAAKVPEGYGARLDDGRLYGEALLDPTPLYSIATEALFRAGIIPHYAVNVTGHGWRKLMRADAAFTYRIRSLPAVPPVLSFIQRHAGIDAREAYGILNMGAGFAVFVAPADVEPSLKAFKAAGFGATAAGVVESGPKRVVIEPLGVEFGAGELKLRAGASAPAA